jgi:hypothetical protein
MMDDRELLELAAKAAGLKVYAPSGLGGLVLYGQLERWNPLSDDGDALRLAVRLRLSMHVDGSLTEAVNGSDHVATETHLGDPYAATRRAIVRAAAEIGRNMTAENKAPWSDFKGQDIHEGDMIEHPSGERGTVVFLASEKEPSDRWRVDYGGSVHSRLCLQIGDKGQAVVVRNV